MQIFKKYNYKWSEGFTLLEVVLSITIVFMIFSVAAPIYQDYQIRNNIDTSVSTIIENLRRAQTMSLASDGDSTWGVNVANGVVTLFKGINFAARDVSFDEIYDMPNIITPAGLTEIVFSKLNGEPNSTGILTLTTNGNVRSISINEKGSLTY